MAGRIAAHLGGSLEDKKIGVLGLTFKPNTDDMREAPSLEIIPGLLALGASVRAFDPAGMENAKRMLDGVAWCEDSYQVMEGADALVILTEWNQFRMLDLDRVRSLMHQPLIIDMRNVYEPGPVRAAGFDYLCVGRS